MTQKSLSGGGGDSKIKGRGKWEYLVALPFRGEDDNAIRTVNKMWNCPDSEPCVQGGEYVVWEFPRFVRTTIESNERLNDIYLTGYFPKCFDDFIFEQQGTTYKPDREKVLNNLNADHNDAHQYLGTYFPRSFVESFCLYDYIFGSFGLRTIRSGKSELTICDVGVGSGGATYGLIWALRKYLYGDPSFKKIRVLGLDGNEKSLEIFVKLKSEVKLKWPDIEFEFVAIATEISKNEVIPKDDTRLRNVDFVIISKCLQEIGKTSSEIQDLYKLYFEEARGLVSERGVISVIEIFRQERYMALKNVFKGTDKSLNTQKVIIAPRHECIKLKSMRIGKDVEEEIAFAAVGRSEILE